MTDDHDPADVPSDELLPEAEERRVAALLAMVPAEPMPADVADRLHAVLAAEVRDRASAGPASTREPTAPEPTAPVPLASRRRRVAPVLAAAAVVVGVVAVGVPVVTGQLGGGQDESAGGGSAADTSRSDGRDEAGPDALAQPPAPGAAEPSARSAPPRVDDLASLPASLRPAPVDSVDRLVCRSEALAVPSGRTIQVLLRGVPAWVVISDADGDSDGDARELVAYRCADVADGEPAARIATAPLR